MHGCDGFRLGYSAYNYVMASGWVKHVGITT